MTTTTITQESTMNTTINAIETQTFQIATISNQLASVKLNITSKRQSALLSILNKRMGGGNNPMPAFNHACAMVTARGILIVGDNLRLMIPGTGRVGDELAFPLSDVLSRMNGEVELFADGMRTAKSTVAYPVFNVNDLPAPVDYRHNFIAHMRMQGLELSQKLAMVSHAMAKDDVRDYLNGVFIEIEGGDITLIATDGHQLATTKIHVITRDTQCFDVFKHQFAIRNTDIAILQLLLKHSPTVSVAFFPEYAEFSGDDWVLACKRLDEYYPTWQTVIPRDEQPIKLSRTNMLDFVYSLKQRKASKFNGVTLSIDEIGILTVHSRGVFNNDARVEVTDRIELDYAYQPMINGIGFNRKYLISALEVAIKAGVNVATFGFTDEFHSISVRFDDFIGVVMPMKL